MTGDSFGDDFNGAATFESTGVGFISACPDPDAVTDSAGTVTSNGPGMAFTHDHDGDTVADHCHQTGFQAKNAAGDGEFHARLNNSTEAGDQTVVFCDDTQQDATAAADAQPSGHGCSDATVKDSILIHWLTGDPETAATDVSINRDRRHFRGQVTSEDDRCVSRRNVTLRKVRRGPDAGVGRTSTDDQGNWTIRKARARGRFYVKVARSSFTDLDGVQITCAAARSRTIRVR